MKTIFSAAASALLVTAASAAIAPAAYAQAAPGIGVLDPEGAVQNSQAYQTAIQQIQTAHAAVIQQANDRSTAFQQEMAPQVQAFQQARQDPNADRNALATQYQQIETRRQQAEQELQQLMMPVARARAYVEEQIAAQLPAALRTVIQQRGIAVVLRPEAVIQVAPSANLTADVTTQLNTLVPSVSITPPADWQPGQQGQQQQQAAPAAPTEGR
ncbi:OmpH family outer membrane protein [Stakelama tenebrarum]|uniref:OmpH family outer membrane protein n=1 Tax=Stakelama tenebrarum TaxID=2711215 RepID=A0A6G6Y5Q5_9SPHN|nr:OmpH family outer membrane protein [Sphingosinithalassobacter tenebrarum]QIG80284.1 OmpH family outer membrane protein [Sphingosinithalassobacter tenebrarum]